MIINMESHHQFYTVIELVTGNCEFRIYLHLFPISAASVFLSVKFLLDLLPFIVLE